jgi:hypothetical protein
MVALADMIGLAPQLLVGGLESLRGGAGAIENLISKSLQLTACAEV